MSGSSPRTSLSAALREATARLAEAGVPSPQADAVALAAHLMATSYGEVRRRAILGEEAPAGLAGLVARRATRVPLQHLTGVAHFRRLELAVGPGVFVPRPETEILVGLALDELAARAGERACVVDLCTGSGAIALAVADECARARVWAVEASPSAFAWAQRNVDGLARDVTLVLGDASAELAELAPLEGTIDVVTCNPPYIPVGAVPRDPEVRDHDPEMALYGGSDDGLALPCRMALRAAALLRPGGVLLMEHADAQGEALPAALTAQGLWCCVRDEPDLTGRPRVSVARRR